MASCLSVPRLLFFLFVSDVDVAIAPDEPDALFIFGVLLRFFYFIFNTCPREAFLGANFDLRKQIELMIDVDVD